MVGTFPSATFGDFIEMENVIDYLFPEPLKYRYFIFGVDDQLYNDRTAIANRLISSIFPASNKLTVRYPNESYDEYISSISVLGNSRSDFYHTVGESIPDEFKHWDGSFLEADIENVKLETKLSKDATLVHIWLGTSVETVTTVDSKSWHFYLPGKTQYSIGLPQLPQLFSGLFPDVFQSGYTFEGGEVVEIIGSENTYRDFTRQFLNEGNKRKIYGDYLFGNNSAMMLASVPISNSGGRKGRSFKPTSPAWEPPDKD